MLDWNTIVLAVLTLIGGGASGGVLATWFARRKLAAEAQAISVRAEVDLSGAAMELTNLLRNQLSEMMAQNSQLRQIVELERQARQNAEDRERKVQQDSVDRERALKVEIADLKTENIAVKREHDHLRQSIAAAAKPGGTP